ncbi:MAG: thioredoxin family protein [Fluviicola sp.]|nr:thioredoxin family protein [Fluviicola sp.]
MKRLLVVYFILLGVETQAQINFLENQSFVSIQEQAAQTNKLIFMDCYTSWCGPCKWLVNNVFSDSSVGEVYNNQFVNVKFDMEKGEGLDLAKRFNITAYPTLLWLNSKGEVVFKVVGTNTTEAFIDYAKQINNESNLFPNLVNRYLSGERDSSFLKLLAETAQIAADEHSGEYTAAYFQTIPQKDWANETNRVLLVRGCLTFDSPQTKFVLNNRKLFDNETIDAILYGCLDIEMRNLLASKSEADLKQFLALIDQIAPEFTDYRMRAEMYFYQSIGDFKKTNELASNYLKHSKDSDLLNEYAWFRFENETAIVLLKEALKWAKKSVKLNENSYNTDTLGQLYNKLGKPRKANKWLNRSKELESK